jgi:hypothetical protein
MLQASRCLRLVALVALASCHRVDPEASSRAAASAAANPGVPAVDPSLPAGVLVVDLVAAVDLLAIDKPAAIAVSSARFTWNPGAPARFEHLAAGERHEIGVSGPYLFEPAAFPFTFTFPSPSHGARIAVKVIPFAPLPPPTPFYAERSPSQPEHVLELDLTRPDTIGFLWSQGATRTLRERDGWAPPEVGQRFEHGTTIAISDVSRAAPDLTESFRRQWDSYANHKDPADNAADRAIVRAEPTASVASIAPVLAALLAIRRERSAHPGIPVPVFDVAITPPVVEPKLLLDDEIGTLDIVAGSPDRGAAIAGAVDRMRDALAKCGVAACSPALRARLLLHLGEALSAAGRREDAELAFFDARAVDPTIALDPGATASSAAIFAAARRRRLPGPRVEAMTVSGRLAPGVIEAGMAAREGLVRLCYVEGLRRNPRLFGRLTARFVIGADGVLSLVLNGGTDLTDGRAVQCLLDTFRGLTFPRPEAGIVAVVYPIVLEPAPKG